MAAASRSLSDRRYVARKPLFSAERQLSTLKKMQPQRVTDQEKQQGADRSGCHSMKSLTKPGEEPVPLSLDPGPTHTSLPSTSEEDLGPLLGVSELLSQLHREESTTFGTSFTRLAQKNRSSSNLQVHRLNPPRRPRLASTVLYPTSTPRSGFSEANQTRLGLESRKERSLRERRLCSPGANPKGLPKSLYQANYWACAIPEASPPSADRHSAGWDPNTEYQALLDYTYPLRPGQGVSEWASSKRLQEGFVLHSDLNLQDSGIALDHRCSSSSLSGLDTSVSVTGPSKERSSVCPSHLSPDLQLFRSADEAQSLLSLSLDCLDHSKDRGTNSFSADGHNHQHLSSSASSAFIHSAGVLPQSVCVCGEVDEEFRPLPDQLEELQLLSREVRVMTAQLSQPATATCVDPRTTSTLSSTSFPEQQDEKGAEDEEAWAEEHTAALHSNAKSTSSHSEAWVDPAGGRLVSLREAEHLVDQLCGVSLIDSWEEEEQSDSLMQHIQVFCSRLQLLIQQLHVVLEKMAPLTAPTVEMDSVKFSLAEYQRLQREVVRQQPLTSCALRTGQLLLRCINSTSPLLTEALLLIERQSGALQTHSEHLLSSILSAIDTLARPVQQSTEDDPVVV